MRFEPEPPYRQPKVDQQPAFDPSWRGARDGRGYVELSVYSGDIVRKPLGWIAISWPEGNEKNISANLESEIDEYRIDG